METKVRSGLIVTPVSQVLDEISGRRLHGTIRRYVRDGRLEHAVDLRLLAYVDSPTLAALIRALRAVREVGGSISLIVDQPQIRKVLSVTGLDRIFSVYHNETEAFSDAEAYQVVTA